MRRKLILSVLLIVLFSGLLFFFDNTIKFGASSFLFKKLASLKSLGIMPGGSVARVLQTNNEEAFLDSARFKSRDNILEAVVIFRPPAVVYDQLIINKGFAEGIKQGQLVLAKEGVIIGEIGEVFEKSSRVVSFSAYGIEQNVFLEKAGIEASARGKGNNELIITLPRDFPIFVGDRIFSLTDAPYLIGFIEEVDSSPNSPVKTLKIKQPFNIFNIYSVGVVM